MRNRLIPIFLFSILLPLLFSCNYLSDLVSPEYQSTADFTGKVVYPKSRPNKADTLLPLEGARITFDSKTAVSDNRGDFFFSAVPTGRRMMSVTSTLPGISEQTFSADIKLNPELQEFIVIRNTLPQITDISIVTPFTDRWDGEVDVTVQDIDSNVTDFYYNWGKDSNSVFRGPFRFLRNEMPKQFFNSEYGSSGTYWFVYKIVYNVPNRLGANPLLQDTLKDSIKIPVYKYEDPIISAVRKTDPLPPDTIRKGAGIDSITFEFDVLKTAMGQYIQTVQWYYTRIDSSSEDIDGNPIYKAILDKNAVNGTENNSNPNKKTFIYKLSNSDVPSADMLAKVESGAPYYIEIVVYVRDSSGKGNAAITNKFIVIK